MGTVLWQHWHDILTDFVFSFVIEDLSEGASLILHVSNQFRDWSVTFDWV